MIYKKHLSLPWPVLCLLLPTTQLYPVVSVEWMCWLVTLGLKLIAQAMQTIPIEAPQPSRASVHRRFISNMKREKNVAHSVENSHWWAMVEVSWASHAVLSTAGEGENAPLWRSFQTCVRALGSSQLSYRRDQCSKQQGVTYSMEGCS